MSADLSRDLPILRPAFNALAAPLNRAFADAGLNPLDARILTDRVGELALSAPGRASANGSCRLYRASDGWIALNRARPYDETLLPAWLEADLDTTVEDGIAEALSRRPAAVWAERGALLGLAVARLGEADGRQALRTTRLSRPRVRKAQPRVVDLSSLWAGPLCSHLLHRLGAEVTKVESLSRPDGARRGTPAFFEWLNGGKIYQTVNLSDPAGIAALRDMMLAADVVIEASRPRALRQFGLDAETLMPLAPGLVWLSITGHGREGEQGRRIGYGDDAAVAGGLVAREASGAPRFLADAVADPLTGVHAAGAVLEALSAGGGLLLDVALAGVAARAARTLTSTGSEGIAA